MAEYQRLPDQKYAEAEYLFQTIEMAKSDEEWNDVDLCSTPPPAGELVEQQEPASIFSWKEVTRRRHHLHRRYTVSHGAPPAPPSTPTSLTASSAPTPSPTASSEVVPSTPIDDERLGSLLYILDYAPKYKKKLKEQQRTDAELAHLFKVFTITGGSAASANGNSSGNSSGSGHNVGSNNNNVNVNVTSKVPPERGVSATSRVIRKHDGTTKIFKIHRNPKEFFRDLDEEDSVSAPEYDTEEEEIRHRRFARLKPTRRLLLTKQQRRFARFRHRERMDAILDTFDAAMSFDGDIDANGNGA